MIFVAINKVELRNGTTATTLIDLSSDTVTSDSLINGFTAHDKAGMPIQGLAISGKIAWGTKEPEYNVPFDTLRITGIVDALGNSFTPNGFALIRCDEEPTTYSYSSNGVIAIVHTNDITSRITLYTSASRTIRTNPSKIAATQFGNGWFQYRNTNEAYYLQPGNWLWVAWRF